jgi:hypothetical protein
MIKARGAYKAVPDDEAEALKGQALDGRHYDQVIAWRPAVLYEDNIWPPLLVYLPGALDPSVCGPGVREALRRAARPSTHQDGRRSGTVGSFNGRECAFNRDDPGGYGALRPLFRDLDRVYREADGHIERRNPGRGPYRDQRAFARLTRRDLLIPGTVFTSAQVNDTVALPAHRHRGNLALGMGVMTVLRGGAYDGGLFVLPQYRLAVDMGDRDVVVFASDAWHGNTAFEPRSRTRQLGGIVPRGGPFERLSVAAYYQSRAILDR